MPCHAGPLASSALTNNFIITAHAKLNPFLFPCGHASKKQQPCCFKPCRRLSKVWKIKSKNIGLILPSSFAQHSTWGHEYQ
eukprot:1160983-Pelagomonas_calceolata.AAC.9